MHYYSLGNNIGVVHIKKEHELKIDVVNLSNKHETKFSTQGAKGNLHAD